MSQPPLRVKVVTPCPPSGDGFELLLPAAGFPGLEFAVNTPEEECDFLVVCWGVEGSVRARVAPHNTLFMCGEPPGISGYGAGFPRQFHHWRDCAPRADHPRVRVGPPGLNCLLGHSDGRFRRTLDDLASSEPEKTGLLSVICSAKSKLPGHRDRLEFIEALKAHFGDRLHHYGRGFRPVPDKWDVVAPYRYHVAVENSILPNYWTEKLADAFLGLSFPFYAGAPNAGDCFPAGSFEPIPVHDPAKAIAVIERGVADDLAAKRMDALRAARARWAAHWSPFAVIARDVKELWRPGDRKSLRVWSHKRFRPFPRGLLYGLRQGK